MQKDKTLFVAFLVTLIGTLFSGYLTIAKFVTTKCVLAEGCYYILGYPTCMYGFVMFVVLLAGLSVLMLGKAGNRKEALNVVLVVSLIGVVFSAFSTTMQLLYPIIPDMQYALLMPTCFYGFFMYLIVFILAMRMRSSVRG